MSEDCLEQLDGMTCPDCGAKRREDGFNRDGWFYAECDRAFNPFQNCWRMPTRGCLNRQLDNLRAKAVMAIDTLDHGEKNPEGNSVMLWLDQFQFVRGILLEISEKRRE